MEKEAIVNADGKSDETKEKAQAQGKDNATEKGSKMIPKERFDQVNQQKKEALEALQSIVDELIEDIPEEFKDLVPDLSPAVKIMWIRNAQKKGIFGKTSPDGLDTKRSGNTAPRNLEGLSTHDLRKLGYKN